MDNKIEALLQDIKKDLEELKAKQKASENFNIFSTLGVELLETRHSKFLAELLNPNGSHGCNDLFLKQFLLIEPIQNRIKEIDIDRFCKSVKVETEQFHIVEKNQSYIDIVLEWQDTAIVIENKIYAPDQHKQLYRYHKAKNGENFKNIILVYLTLDGKSPTEQSLNNLTYDDIELLSYEVHITDWLMSVIEIVEFENIKNIIDQYLTTLEQLTNKNSKEENNLIADYLMKDDNLQTAIKISNALPRAKAIFEMEFYKVLIHKLMEDLKQYSFLAYEADDWYFNFDENDIQWIINNRKQNRQKDFYGFVGLYFFKELSNGKKVFLKFGENYGRVFYLELFLSKNGITRYENIRKKDLVGKFKLESDNSIELFIMEGLNFSTNDIVYFKNQEELDTIIETISNKTIEILEMDDYKIFENNLANQ